MKRIILIACLIVLICPVFAESKSFNFGELADDNIIVTTNTSR